MNKEEHKFKSEQKEILEVKATRYGWKDFFVNFCFSIIMIASYVVIIFVTPPSSISDWILASITILVPLVVFLNRTLKELTYTKDFIKIDDTVIEYRSTPLVTTGLFKIKKGQIKLIELRKLVLTKIPRKLSIDLFRHKNKAILVLYLRSGQQYIIGEYIANEDLYKVVETLYRQISRLKIAPETFKHYPDLDDILKRIRKRKTIKKTGADDLEGVSIRG